MYNLPDPDKIEAKTKRKHERIRRKNIRRIAKGKDTLDYKPAAYWYRFVAGEPPTLLDSGYVENSRKFLSNYLISKGYFNNEVSVHIKYNQKKKRANVDYIVKAGVPYLIENKVFSSNDYLRPLVERTPDYPIVNEGDRFDVDLMDEEREKITEFLKNNGFYYFNKDLIYYQADSTDRNYKVSLEGGITGSNQQDSISNDFLRTWRINKIEVAQIGLPLNNPTEIGDYLFYSSNELAVNPQTIIQNILIGKGDYYKANRVQLTYRRLLSLPIFSNVSIQFTRSDIDGFLDCFISLRKAEKQSFSIETKGTNSSGFLGIEGDLIYRNKNIFGGAELLTVKLIGGIQAQAALTDEDQSNVTLNTIEIGPEVKIQFPKFLLPVNQNKIAQSANPKTNLSSSFSYQSRPDYQRTITNFKFGYSWNETESKKHYINPLEMSIIKINPTADFTMRLEELNNRLLTDAYRDHFITSLVYGFNFNSQRQKFQKDVFYYQGNLESSGSLLRGIMNLTNQEQDSLGAYSVAGIRFAQFLKLDNDFRYYRNFSSKNSLVARFAGGLGVPLKNLDVLPFSESFFAGGSNGIRAWQARSLGPGSYFEPNVILDKIGDIHLEANIEYRFDLIDYLEGALFYDAGNIWLIDEDPLRPGSSFTSKNFLGEIAMGAGLGFRLDFDFFIIRLDVGTQLKDPALNKGERWFFQPKDEYNAAIDLYNNDQPPGRELEYYKQQYTFNLGINYPF